MNELNNTNNGTNNQVEKPITMKIAEFKSQMVTLINNIGLPFYALEPIMKDFYQQTVQLEKQEAEQVEKQYQQSLMKSEDNSEGDNN